ncbi:hypothetical protein [Amycolatopsis alkalitolerans]|uniref:Uncharacterized protein n=1 Tax=Amycolatopsis alkalitolerans TaxID=2547244 RepID=A0A5C4M188_9PSEU|nr:hypothetical protein [Amycolatopsis alkalitolerans]TNC24631.1 hypothetical protein FG385_17680 [Amycolatopsis alkalitolerans]
MNLYYRKVTSAVRPFVAGGQENVWCEDTGEWWPFTADAIGLFTLRIEAGDRALCAAPGQ